MLHNVAPYSVTITTAETLRPATSEANTSNLEHYSSIVFGPENTRQATTMPVSIIHSSQLLQTLEDIHRVGNYKLSLGLGTGISAIVGPLIMANIY